MGVDPDTPPITEQDLIEAANALRSAKGELARTKVTLREVTVRAVAAGMTIAAASRATRASRTSIYGWADEQRVDITTRASRQHNETGVSTKLSQPTQEKGTS